MPRRTSGLFLACTESALLSIILYTLLSGVMELLSPPDFSPGMRSAMLAHTVLSVCTGLLVAALAGLDRARDILSSSSSPSDAAAQDGRDETASVLKWIARRRGHGLNTLSVCNAYCSCTLAVFLLYFCEFMQAVSGWGLDDQLVPRASVNASSRAVYSSSQRLDWIQASAGSSGWTLVVQQSVPQGNTSATNNATTTPSALLYAVAEKGSLPVMGSVFAGAVLGFLLLGLLLSLYTSLSATPEGEFSYLVLEPRGLTVCNGILVFGSLGTVEHHFAFCAQDVAGSSTLFALFCLLACLFDEIPALVLWLFKEAKKKRSNRDKAKKGYRRFTSSDGDADDNNDYGKGQTNESQQAGDNSDRLISGRVLPIVLAVARCLMLLTMCWTPLVAIYVMKEQDSSHLPYTVVTASSILGAVSTVTALLDVFLFSSGGTFSSALQSAYALISKNDKRMGEEDNSGKDNSSINEKEKEEENDAPTTTAAKESKAADFSMKGFPGAAAEDDADQVNNKDEDEGGKDETVDAAEVQKKELSSMYSLVDPRDLYMGALARRPATTTTAVAMPMVGGAGRARGIKNNDRKWHVA